MSVLRSVAAKLPTYVDQEGSKTAVCSHPPNGHLSSQHKSLYMSTVSCLYMSQFYSSAHQKVSLATESCAAVNYWFGFQRIRYKKIISNLYFYLVSCSLRQ